MVCDSIFNKLKKRMKIKWDQEYTKEFAKIKDYLSNPPVLVPIQPGIPQILYLTKRTTTMGAMLAKKIKGEERAIYISKTFLEYEGHCMDLGKLPWPWYGQPKSSDTTC